MARRWTSAEDAQLRSRYDAGMPVVEIADLLARSVDALVARRAALGIPPRRVPLPWSELEDRLLRSAVEAHLPLTALAGRLERSIDQIHARRRQLGLAARTALRYTPTEDALLRAAWTAGIAVDELARRRHRSPEAMRLRARALGLHHPERRRRWTAVEDATLRDGYADGLTCRRIADGLPDRNARLRRRARPQARPGHVCPQLDRIG